MNLDELSSIQKSQFQDCFNMLVKTNEENLRSAKCVGGRFLYGRYAEFIFSASEEFSLGHECPFLALELFNRFMRNHLFDVQRSLKDQISLHLQTGMGDYERTVITEQVKEEYITLVGKQVPLRLISCIQLASKFLSCQYVSSARAKDILWKMGFRFSLSSISSSEIRVWKTLEYSVNVQTPFSFVEMLCEVLANIFSIDLNVVRNPLRNTVFETSLILLQYFYIIRPFFYYQLFRKVSLTEKLNAQDKLLIARISADQLLLSAGIVATATKLNFGEEPSIEVIKELSNVVQLSNEDICDVVEVFTTLFSSPPVTAKEVYLASEILN